MNIAEVGEFGLIEIIKRLMEKQGEAPSGIVKGIGDDCAVIRPKSGRDLILTTDTLVENVHFDLAWISFYQLGWKAIATNLSDSAAMGAAPLVALSSLALPPSITKEAVEEIYRGIGDLSTQYHCPIIGGNLTNSSQGVMISFTVIGEVPKGKALYRSGAKVGDEIWVTGNLGTAHAGLQSLLHSPSLSQEVIGPLRERFLQPLPRIDEVLFLRKRVKITSLIDLSDGLSSDLRHICEASKVGAKLFASKIPVAEETQELANALGHDPLRYALSGGEDYELCFTAKKGAVKRKTIAEFQEMFGLLLTNIGEILEEEEILLVQEDQQEIPLHAQGFDHFREKTSV